MASVTTFLFYDSALSVDKTEWNRNATTLLKSELARSDVRYDELVARLARLGVEETYAGLANKINRGSFSFTFFMQCMKALGRNTVRFDAE